MTTQQVKRLCAVDPNHFGIMMGGLWFDRHGKDWTCKGKAVWSYDLPHVEAESLGVALWWMLSQLPKGTILCWEDKQNKFVCYVRTKEGRDVNAYGVRGFGETREDALIEAYIGWQEATEDPNNASRTD